MPKTASLLGGTDCLDFVNGRDNPHAGEELPPDLRPRVQRFRAALGGLLMAEARGIGATEEDLGALNRILAAAGGRRGLVSTVRGYGWGWLDAASGIERMLWPIAFSAARLLESRELDRLKACDGCGRLFLDASHNRSRRWCDMQGCGNRAKAARHRARKD